jgi:hypothetical protein
MGMGFGGGGMRKAEQRMGMTEHRMMAEHGNEKRRTRNGRTRNDRILLQP